MDGVIVVDKPEGWTSHDAVNKLRRLAGTRRVGHLGTLDPLATGVLQLVVGRATRLAQFLMRGPADDQRQHPCRRRAAAAAAEADPGREEHAGAKARRIRQAPATRHGR